MGILWPQSGTISRDNSDNPATGAKAYFFEGATTTPLTVYEDAGESTAHDHPVVADGNGRWPAIFIPFVTSYDEKVTTSGGTQLYYYVEIPNPDPVEQAANPAAPEELIATGDTIFRFVNTTKAGFVRANGRTMGNAASGGTERANADTVALFTHLYNSLADAQAAVSGGRGANAAADYAANKTITLPDLRGAFPLGLDDMGNTAASLLGGTTFVHGNATTAGSIAGTNTHVLTLAQLAAHTHSADGTLAAASGGAHVHDGETDGQSDDHTHQYGGAAQGGPTGGGTLIGDGTTHTTSGTSNNHTHNFQTDSGGSHTHDVTGNTSSTGSDAAHNILSRSVLVTYFIKL